MRTVADVVGAIIERSPYLSEMLADDLANSASVARHIKPKVEAALLEQVSLGSISMALHRLQKHLVEPQFGTRFLSHIQGITVRSNLIQFVCTNFLEIPVEFEKIFKIARDKRESFLNFSRGLRESTLIVSKDLEEDALAALRGKKHIRKVDKLSAITIILPDSCLNVPGVYSPFLKTIAQEGISLVEAMSIRTEFTIVLAEKDVERGFAAIKRITS